MPLSNGVYTAGIATLVAQMVAQSATLNTTLTQQFKLTQDSIDGIVLQMIEADSKYNEGLGALADAQIHCCDKKDDFNRDVAYVDYPVEVTHADGTITQHGPVSDYHNALRADAAAFTAAHDKDDAFRNKLQDHEEKKWNNQGILYWIQMIAGLIAAIQGMILFNKFMGILNDIMDDVRDNVGDLRGANAGLIAPTATHAQEWVENNPARIAELDAVNAHMHEYGDTTWDHWNGVFKANEAAVVPEIYTLALDMTASIKETVTALTAAADEAEANYNAMYAQEGAVAGAALTAAQCSAERLCELRDWLQANAEKIEGFWDATYAGNSTTIANAAVAEGATATGKSTAAVTELQTLGGKRDGYYDANYAGPEGALAGQVMGDGVTQSGNSVADHADMVAKAADRIAYFNGNYAGHEATLAGVAIDEAATLVDKLSEDYEYLKTHGETMQAFWDAAYKAAEQGFADKSISEGTIMVDKFSDDWEWFDARAIDMRAFWDATYRPSESAVAPVLINRAQAMSDQSVELINYISQLSEEMKDYWDAVYKAAESTTAPVIIDGGVPGTEHTEFTYKWFEDRFQDFFKKWEDDWYPCDKKDLGFLCAMWDNHNMAEEIHDDKDLSRSLADKTYEAYTEHGLPCEVERIDEICAMPVYEPEYCEVESKAILHVRAQIDRQKEEAKRCNTRFCCGATQQSLDELTLRGAQLETASLQAAHRYEKWWYVQEENRRHKYHQDIFQIAEQHPQTTDRSLNTSIRANDLILKHLHDRIQRGYTYLENMQNTGRLALQGMSDAVRYSIETIRAGHFFPEIALKGKTTADQHSQQHVQFGIDMIKTGQFYPRMAHDDRAAAETTANDASRVAAEMVRIGHFFPELALKARVAAEQTAQDAGQLGQRMVELGHFHPRLHAQLYQQASANAGASTTAGVNMARTGQGHYQEATKAWNASGSIADAQTGKANDAMRLGPQYAQLAASKSEAAVQASLGGMKVGIDTISNGHFWPRMARDNRTAATSAGQNALGSAVQLMQVGQRYNALSNDWHAKAAASLGGTIDKAFNHLYNTVNMFNSGINGGASAGTAGTLGGLRQASDATGAGLQTFGDAYAKLFPGSIGNSGATTTSVSTPASIGGGVSPGPGFSGGATTYPYGNPGPGSNLGQAFNVS